LIDNRNISDPKGVASILNENFNEPICFTNNLPAANYTNIPLRAPRPSNSFFLTPTVENEVTSCRQELGNSHSRGPDEIPGHKSAKCCSVITSPLTHIINESFKIGALPSALKTAKVTLIHIVKKLHFGSKQLLTHLNNIIILKISEKIICNHMTSYLVKYNILSPSPHGFQKGKSTLTALIETIYPQQSGKSSLRMSTRLHTLKKK
jgi:hypothetical protein